MRVTRWLLIVLLLASLGAAIYQTLLWRATSRNTGEVQVKPLEQGEQEIALIEPATNMDDWGQIVSALTFLQRDWPKINPKLPALEVNLDNAFPMLTTEVPEIVLSLGPNSSQRLLLRWYKISGDNDISTWVHALHKRWRSPLAIIGGSSSDRAVELARDLKETYADASQAGPVLLITTATAEKTDTGFPLIEIYKGRSFRFSFTNQKMVEALLHFAQARQYPEEEGWARSLWVHKANDPQVIANSVAWLAGIGGAWNAWGTVCSLPLRQRYTMYAFSWKDERYSQDIADLFDGEFRRQFPYGEFSLEPPFPSGIGDFFHPSVQEQSHLDVFLSRHRPFSPYSFVLLPTQTVRVRRTLMYLRHRVPLAEVRNFVIFSGDSIGFNTVFRDRKMMWNSLDLPYSLVFFSHRNPIDPSVGFTWKKADVDPSKQLGDVPLPTTTGTQDLLLYRDVFEALLHAVYEGGQLIDSPDRLTQKLQGLQWNASAQRVGAGKHEATPSQRLFFDSAGNRQSHTGEHIVWVTPFFADDLVESKRKISVWVPHPDELSGPWQLSKVETLSDRDS
jgi:hypothetical protein